uniref:LSM12 LSM domain-containing protein n=1 Tax=Aegilops tauschii subsp. strangulata TaxID=200361 RepID=A0A453PKR3_AEGTS
GLTKPGPYTQEIYKRKALQTGRSLFRIPTCSPLARASPRRICRTLKPHADTAPLRPHPGHLLPPTAAGGVMEVGGEEFAVGVVISAKTTLGEEFEGQIVSFDRPSNLLVIHHRRAWAGRRGASGGT